jgi:hypothetical protein
VASGTSIYALSGTLNSLTAPTFISSNATISGGTINGTPIGNLVPSTGVFTDTTSTNSFSTNLAAVNANLQTATIGSLTLTSPLTVANLVWTNATGTNTTSTNLFATNLGATNANLGSLTVTGLTNLQGLSFAHGTSTSWFGFNTASGTNLYASNIQVNGSSVCLQNGTNCPSGTTPDFQTVTNVGNTTTNAIQFAGGTSTASFLVQNTLTASGTLIVDGTVGSNLNPSSDLAYTLGTAALRWDANLGSVTATSLVATASLSSNGALSVLGQSTLGNVSTTNQSISGTLSVLGLTDLGDVVFVDATGTNLYLTGSLTAASGAIATLNSTNLTSQNANFTNSTSTNGYVTTLTGMDSSFVNSTSTNQYVQNQTVQTSNVTDLTATNATLTNLVVTNLTVSSSQPSYFANLTWGSATGTNLVTTDSTSTHLFAVTGNIQSLYSTTGSVAYLSGTNSTFQNSTSTNLFSTNGTIQTFGSTDLSFAHGTSTSWFGFNVASGTSIYALSGTLNSLTAPTFISSNATISGGTINGTPIGATTPSTGIFTNATSTGWLGFATASGTNLYASNVQVNGSSVCLANGSNCPSSIAPTLQSVTNLGSTTTETLGLFGGFVAASSTVTSTFTVLGDTSLQNAIFINATGTSVTTTNLAVLALVNSDLNPTRDSVLSIGSSTLRWNAYFGSATATAITSDYLLSSNVSSTNLTATNATITTLAVTNLSVGGTSVCLGDGTNCQGSIKTVTGVDAITVTGVTEVELLAVTSSIPVFTTNTYWGVAQVDMNRVGSAPNAIIQARRGLCNSGVAVGASSTILMGASNPNVVITVSFVDTVATTSAVGYRICARNTGTGSYTSNRRTFTLNQTFLGADLAEVYYSQDATLQPGEVVSLDPTMDDGVMRSALAYDSRAIGVISTQPGHLLASAPHSGGTPVTLALSGRVPVKVSAENGSIHSGDPLTAASRPGYAMKATKPGFIIGRAIQSFSWPDDTPTSTVATGIVMMAVQPGYYFGVDAVDSAGQLAGFLGDTTSTQIIEKAASGDVGALLQVAGGTVNPQVAAGSQILNNVKLAQIDVLLVRTAAVIAGDLTVVGTTRLAGHMVVAEDTAGVIDLPVGESYVEVRFKKPYEAVPVVVVTPESDAKEYFAPWMGRFHISKKTVDGFRIDVDEGACIDPSACGRTLRFNWIAVGSLASATSTADGTTVTPTTTEPIVKQTTSTPETVPSTEPTVTPADTTSTTEIPPAETPPTDASMVETGAPAPEPPSGEIPAVDSTPTPEIPPPPDTPPSDSGTPAP